MLLSCPETHLCACVPCTVCCHYRRVGEASIKSAVMRLTLQLCNRERKRASMLSWRCKEKALLSVLEYFPSMYLIRNIIVYFKVKYVWMELFLSNLQGNFFRNIMIFFISSPTFVNWRKYATDLHWNAEQLSWQGLQKNLRRHMLGSVSWVLVRQ